MNRTPAFLLLAFATLFAGTQALAQTCPGGNPRVAPDSRYARSEPVAGERVVIDTATGLVWKECVEGRSGAGCGDGWSAAMNWANALVAASNSTWGGYDDWRLPNINELYSLVETGCQSPGINTSHFPDTSKNGIYWSSSSHAADASLARGVNFEFGLLNTLNKSANAEVRLVRGGQWLDAFDAVVLFADGFVGD